MLNFKSSLYVLNNNPVLDMAFANIFSVACLLIMLTASFTKETLILIESNLSIIFFMLCVLSVSNMALSDPKLSVFAPVLFSRSFTVFCFRVRSMAHLD